MLSTMAKRASGTVILLLLLMAGLAGCVAIPKHKVHYSLLRPEAPAVPQRMLLLPTGVAVYEVSSGGLIEEVGEWSELARKQLRKSLERGGDGREALTLVELPELDLEQSGRLHEHLALYETVSASATYYIDHLEGNAWTHKARRFDYTIGDGLAFLRELSGADTALIIQGEDLISSSGRVATAIFAAAFGVSMPMGYTVLTAGVIDLKSGDLLWTNYTFSQTADMREPGGAGRLVDNLFRSYPGLEPYRNLARGE